MSATTSSVAQCYFPRQPVRKFLTRIEADVCFGEEKLFCAPLLSICRCEALTVIWSRDQSLGLEPENMRSVLVSISVFLLYDTIRLVD